MKLESLKSSKFEALRSNAITDAFAVLGGQCQNTSVNGQLADSVDHETHNTPTLAYTCDSNIGHDYWDSICPIGPSEGQGASLPHP